MRLLLDQNLSPRLLTVLGDLYLGSTHVREVGLQAADDDAVWRYTAEHGFVIVSTDEVVAILRDHHAEMLVFEGDEEGSFLALG